MNESQLQTLHAQLARLLAQRSVCRGSFTLVSGAQSDLYVDAKLTTLHPPGAALVGQVGWELLSRTAAARSLSVRAVGGLTMGADAISLAIGLAAFAASPASALETFTVRKTVKAHGRTKLIEGNFQPGDSVVVIDDVITTGGSTLQAIDAIEAEGGKVAFALVLVDREEGGRANIEARGHHVVPILTRTQLLAAS